MRFSPYPASNTVDFVEKNSVLHHCNDQPKPTFVRQELNSCAQDSRACLCARPPFPRDLCRGVRRNPRQRQCLSAASSHVLRANATRRRLLIPASTQPTRNSRATHQATLRTNLGLLRVNVDNSVAAALTAVAPSSRPGPLAKGLAWICFFAFLSICACTKTT